MRGETVGSWTQNAGTAGASYGDAARVDSQGEYFGGGCVHSPVPHFKNFALVSVREMCPEFARSVRARDHTQIEMFKKRCILQK
jgi:hypothetical protein